MEERVVFVKDEEDEDEVSSNAGLALCLFEGLG